MSEDTTAKKETGKIKVESAYRADSWLLEREVADKHRTPKEQRALEAGLRLSEMDQLEG